MGLDSVMSEALEAIAPMGDDAPPVHWLEVASLNHACSQRLLNEATKLLQMLPSFIADANERGHRTAAVHELAIDAIKHIQSGAFLLSRGHYVNSCRDAAIAIAYARAATRHPSLVPLEILPSDYWLTTWPPLVFPVVSAVLAAWAAELRRKRKGRH